MPVARGYSRVATDSGLWDVIYTTPAAPTKQPQQQEQPTKSAHFMKRRVSVSDPTTIPKSPRLTNGTLGKSRACNSNNPNCATHLGSDNAVQAASFHAEKKVFPQRNATKFNLIAAVGNGLPAPNAAYRPTAPYGTVNKEN